MDAQIVLVSLIIIAAAAFIGRRWLLKLAAFSSDKQSGCGSGCGKCGEKIQK